MHLLVEIANQYGSLNLPPPLVTVKITQFISIIVCLPTSPSSEVIRASIAQKDYYEVATRTPAFCELCRKLHDPAEPPMVVEDLGDWWVTRAHCKPKGTLPWS